MRMFRITTKAQASTPFMWSSLAAFVVSAQTCKTCITCVLTVFNCFYFYEAYMFLGKFSETGVMFITFPLCCFPASTFPVPKSPVSPVLLSKPPSCFLIFLSYSCQ